MVPSKLILQFIFHKKNIFSYIESPQHRGIIHALQSQDTWFYSSFNHGERYLDAKA